MEDGPQRCGPGIRGVAMAIDSVVWFLLWFVAGFPIAAITGDIVVESGNVNADLTGTAALLTIALWLALAIGYHTVSEWRFGRTVGKFLVKIRVTNADGSTPTLRASVVRNALRLVDWLPAFYVVGIAAIAASDSSRRIGDRVVDTLVVR